MLLPFLKLAWLLLIFIENIITSGWVVWMSNNVPKSFIFMLFLTFSVLFCYNFGEMVTGDNIFRWYCWMYSVFGYVHSNFFAFQCNIAVIFRSYEMKLLSDHTVTPQNGILPKYMYNLATQITKMYKWSKVTGSLSTKIEQR
jgi:hypothetical protein